MPTAADLPVGIFDSGVGGLTVVRQIHRLMPQEHLVYLGDTARVPYGTKSPGTVIRFAWEDTQFLCQHGVKAVVVACNTASAWALPTLLKEFDLPIFGVILPGVRAALKRSRNLRIGVIGTTATIKSRAYETAIRAARAQARVFVRACPLLVPLVEEGWTRHPVTLRVLQEYLQRFRRRRIDTLVLGCTHYPLLKNAIRRVTHGSMGLVDSAESCARDVREQLQRSQLCAAPRSSPGRIQPFVTDEAARFDRLARRFLGRPAEPARKVELPVYSGRELRP